MFEPNRCPGCGATLPADAPGGLCPLCLLRHGLESEGRWPARDEEFSTASAQRRKRPAQLDAPSRSGFPAFCSAIGAERRLAARSPAGVIRSLRAGLWSRPLPDPGRDRSGWNGCRSQEAATPSSAATSPSRSYSTSIGTHPEFVRRFVEEAQIGGQLQHPGIVPVYELGQFGDLLPYFAMKLVEGRTLAVLLAARGDPATTWRGSWTSSSKSARRWPTRTLGASSIGI